MDNTSGVADDIHAEHPIRDELEHAERGWLMTFRFNNRNNPYLFRDMLIKLIEEPLLEYRKLSAA